MRPLLAVIASSLIIVACDLPRSTPQAFIYVDLVGEVREAEGRASIRSLGSEKFEVSIELREDAAKEWSLSIRDGTCSNPGKLRYRAGVIENETLRSTIDGDVAALSDMILVVSPLGEEDVASCGTIRF